MVNAQEWLDENYPKDKREEVKKLYIAGEDVEGHLDLTDFENLELLCISENDLTSLKLGKVDNLEDFDYSDNQLTSTEFLKALSQSKELKKLNLKNNNFSSQNLEIFANMVNLERLEIGNDDKEKVENGIYNRWYGSLKPLTRLTKVTYFDIRNTDIDSGLEYLPINFAQEYFLVYFKERKESRVKKIFEQLEKYHFKINEWKEKQNDSLKKQLEDLLKENEELNKNLEEVSRQANTTIKDLENKLGSSDTKDAWTQTDFEVDEEVGLNWKEIERKLTELEKIQNEIKVKESKLQIIKQQVQNLNEENEKLSKLIELTQQEVDYHKSRHDKIKKDLTITKERLEKAYNIVGSKTIDKDKNNLGKNLLFYGLLGGVIITFFFLTWYYFFNE